MKLPSASGCVLIIAALAMSIVPNLPVLAGTRATAVRVASTRPSDVDEWWRVDGRLRARDGRHIDYTLTLFRASTSVPNVGSRRFDDWREGTTFIAATTLIDESTQRVERNVRAVRGAATCVCVWGLAWLHDDGATTFGVDLRAEGTQLRMTERATKRAVRLADGERLMTALATTGTLAIAGRTLAVTGKSWYDHSVGHRVRTSGALGWDRYIVQLDDGRELLFESDRFPAKHAMSRALIVDRAGRVRSLAPAAYRLRDMNRAGWRSPQTGVRYPDLWALHVPSETPMLSLEPVVIDQEIASDRGTPFYSGVVDVYDVTPWSMGRRLGTGFVELTGYASPIDL